MIQGCCDEWIMMVNPPHNFEEECLLGVNCVYKVGSLGYFIAVINGTRKQKEIKFVSLLASLGER